jgi:endonuclease/exonuclease/phosphatase family metal-dependent hydrolase
VAAAVNGLRVASWNVREGLPDQSTDLEDRPAALAALVAQVIDQRIDVLALQEVDFDVIGRSAVLAALRTETALEYVHAEALSPSSYLPGHRAGVGLASRVPIAAPGLDLLPNPRLAVGQITTYDKGAIWGTIQTGDLRVTLVSVHAFPFRRFGRTPDEAEFAPIWQSLADQLGKLGDDPLVVCGDFNTPRRDLLLSAVDRQLVRAIGARPTHRGLPIDDILYSAELVVSGAPLVLASFSDHDLCVVTLARA